MNLYLYFNTALSQFLKKNIIIKITTQVAHLSLKFPAKITLEAQPITILSLFKADIREICLLDSNISDILKT